MLKKLKFKIDINKDKKSVKFLDIQYGENQTIMSVKNINVEEIKDNNVIFNKYKQLVIFFDEIEEYIYNSKIKINCEILMELKEDTNTKRVNCISKFVTKYQDNRIIQYIDENILENNINTKSKGFMYLINELENEDYEIASQIYDENKKDYDEIFY